VACYLEEGVHVAKDIPRAVELVRYAAEHGFYDAQKKLAYYHEHGV
jgi:TPR repeat protein